MIASETGTLLIHWDASSVIDAVATMLVASLDTFLRSRVIVASSWFLQFVGDRFCEVRGFNGTFLNYLPITRE